MAPAESRECRLSLAAATDAEVDEVVKRAQEAGA
jgi:predicted lactoylglutathione lyase